MAPSTIVSNVVSEPLYFSIPCLNVPEKFEDTQVPSNMPFLFIEHSSDFYSALHSGTLSTSCGEVLLVALWRLGDGLVVVRS